MSDSHKKLHCAAICAGLFLLVSLPTVYSYTSRFIDVESSCHVYKTKLFHTLVFFLLNMLVMHYYSSLELMLKVRYSIYGALVFFLLSSNEMYNATSSVVKTAVDRCPTTTGLVLHSLAYGGALYGLMSLPRDHSA